MGSGLHFTVEELVLPVSVRLDGRGVEVVHGCYAVPPRDAVSHPALQIIAVDWIRIQC